MGLSDLNKEKHDEADPKPEFDHDIYAPVSDEFDDKGRLIAGKCYRSICPGTMRLQGDVCFVCDYCGISVDKESYYKWVKGLIDLEDGDDYDRFPDYEDVYDEDGNEVHCDEYGCSCFLKFHDGQYQCPSCGRIMPRDEFFNYIGASPLGDKCSTCDQNYPVCKDYCELYDN